MLPFSVEVYPGPMAVKAWLVSQPPCTPKYQPFQLNACGATTIGGGGAGGGRAMSAAMAEPQRATAPTAKANDFVSLFKM